MEGIKAVLIVEDQECPLEALESAVGAVMPSCNYDVVRCYNDAQKRIFENEYDMVLLDNRMPYEDQGDLERRDFSRFSASLENIGYSLIPMIKEKSPNTIVVGTSSLSKEALRGMPAPDFTMSKMFSEAEQDLRVILKGGK